MLCRPTLAITRLTLPMPPLLHQLDELLDIGIRTLVAARLKNSIVLTHGLDHRLLVTDGQPQRLFAVDVLAGLGSHHSS